MGAGWKGGGGSLHASLHDKPTRLGVTPSIRPPLSSFERMWRRLESVTLGVIGPLTPAPGEDPCGGWPRHGAQAC